MTDPTPTPADLERAREWLHDGSGHFPSDPPDCTQCDQVASLAALLCSVREEGARQERERWQRACEEERGLAQRMLDDERPHTLAWKGRLAVIADILDAVTDESPAP